ncbi:MAG: ABC transporter ATP-binding protein [Chloroflexi bacterium]|jgi:ABC-type oligopeptide transport system ATPase subunit|nr:ABC transporter ATP-binding protein [Chloroflexota bacterium]
MESLPDTPLLEMRSVSKIYGGGFLQKAGKVALKDFSLTLPMNKPRIVALAGESGSGKTTAARLALGLLEPTSGQILYKGVDLHRISRREALVFRREVQAIFQDPYEVYNPVYKVDHVFNVLVSRFRLAPDRAAARPLIADALRVVGLDADEVLGKYPHQLSGGQRQRIMVARAFLLKPRLIIADEPVSMVDASLRAAILSIMLKLKEEFGISFLYITHDLSTAYQYSDEIYILNRGEVVESGDSQAVIDNPTHPYTQLLIRSIPIPDPDLKWEGKLEIELENVPE